MRIAPPMAALVGLVALLLPNPGPAASMVELSLAAHVKQSSAVVEATVITKDVRLGRPEGTINTFTTLRIDKVLTGQAPGAVTIRQIGGTLDGITTQVVGDAALPEGGKVVAFVRKWDDGYWYLTALSQSVYHVDGSGDGAKIRRDYQGVSLFQRAVDGRLVHVENPTPDFTSLGSLKAALNALSKEVKGR